MPKRFLKPCSQYLTESPMEKRQKRNVIDPLVAISHNNRLALRPQFSFQKNTKNRRCNYQSDQVQSVKPSRGIAPSTRINKHGLQQVNHDTFQLMDSGNSTKEQSPLVRKIKVLPSKAKRTPPYQKTDSNVNTKPPQTLIDQRKSIHNSLMPELPLQSKLFISVTGDQMANFFKLLGEPALFDITIDDTRYIYAT